MFAKQSRSKSCSPDERSDIRGKRQWWKSRMSRRSSGLRHHRKQIAAKAVCFCCDL
jgi:hypothetical protein